MCGELVLRRRPAHSNSVGGTHGKCRSEYVTTSLQVEKPRHVPSISVIFDPPPKSRRGRYLWPILIVTAVILAVVVTAAGQETRAEIEYLEDMRLQATELARDGSTMTDVMAGLRQMGREEFTIGFDLVSEDLEASRAFIADMPPTESLVPVRALFRQAIEAWHAGVTNLREAILLSADHPGEATSVNAVADALAELRAGDLVYAELQREFEEQDVPDPLTPLPNVVLSPAEGGLASLAISYVHAAEASTNGLGLRPGLAVSQIVPDPVWQINVDGEAVIPTTAEVTFSVVITNKGNVASTAATVTLELVGGESPVLDQMEVPALAPDGQTTVAFDPVPVIPDLGYSVIVRVEITEFDLDSDLDDNLLRVEFVVNAP